MPNVFFLNVLYSVFIYFEISIISYAAVHQISGFGEECSWYHILSIIVSIQVVSWYPYYQYYIDGIINDNPTMEEIVNLGPGSKILTS